MFDERRATIVAIEGRADPSPDVAQTLREAGYAVTSTVTPEEALRVVQEARPDLIIMGVSLPDADGLPLARTIKEDADLARIPILFVSSTGEAAAERIAEVADVYLPAPLAPSVLRLNVRALLRLHAAEQTRSQTGRLLQALQTSFTRLLAYFDTDLTFRYANPTFSEAVAKWPEQLLGRPHTEVLPENGIVARRLRRALDTRKPVRLREIPYRAVVPGRRGPGRWLDVTLVPVIEESGAVEGVLLSAIDVTAEVRLRVQHAEEDRRRREFAETMNREVNHRVKNNLMTLAELLYYQPQSLTDEGARGALDDAVARLNVFARIHEQLQSAPTAEVSLLDLLERVASVSRSSLPEREVEVSVYGEELPLPTEAATNLALVANELITNGLKHGAPDADGRQRIVISLDRLPGRIALLVWSSGNPIPPDFDPSARGGMGLHLVQAMVVRHYGGAFTLCPDAGGTLAQVLVSEPSLREG